MTHERGWWYGASKEKRLAQIRGGQECGMTAKQVAMNCGCYDPQTYSISGGDCGGSLVATYAYRHGMGFPKRQSSGGRVRSIEANKITIEVKRAEKRRDVLDDAFDIFGLRQRLHVDFSMFNEIGAE